MSLFGFSRELLFKVSNQRQSHASPQSARKEEHFYRGEGKMGEMLNSVHFFSLAESLPGKERSQKSLFFLLGAAVVILSIKVIRGFLLGTTWGYWSTLWWWLLFVWKDLSCSEHHRSSQHPREVFSPGLLPTFLRPILRGVMWLVHGHITRKWQSLDSNTGRFPNEAHQAPFLFLIKICQTRKVTQCKSCHLDDF